MTEKKKSKAIRFLVYAIPVILLAYVLSVGPAYAVITNTLLKAEKPITCTHDYDSFYSFYAPLFWVGGQYRVIQVQIDGYIHFCVAPILEMHEVTFLEGT